MAHAEACSPVLGTADRKVLAADAQQSPQDTKQSVSALTGKPREASATTSDGPKIDPKLVQQLRKESGAGAQSPLPWPMTASKLRPDPACAALAT